MNGALIYVRVSSDDQIRRNSANLPTQIRKCKEDSEREGLQVLKIFSDEGKSGRNTEDRPEFQKLMQFCRERKNKGLTVVVSDLSRLARNIEDQAAAMTELARLELNCVPSMNPCSTIRPQVGCLRIFLAASINTTRIASANALHIVWTPLSRQAGRFR